MLSVAAPKSCWKAFFSLTVVHRHCPPAGMQEQIEVILLLAGEQYLLEGLQGWDKLS